MFELLINFFITWIEAPLTGLGMSAVAVLRGVELFVIVLATVFGSYVVRRFVRTLKNRAEKTASIWDDTFFASLEKASLYRPCSLGCPNPKNCKIRM